MERISRRELLERSMMAAVAAAAPALPAAAEAPPRAAGPNDILRVAVVGVKGRGLGHVSHFANMKDVHVAAVCDIDENVISSAMKTAEAKSGKKPAYYADLRKLLEDQSIDAVSIATTNHWHTLAALWTIQAGKDAYVEKPTSHNVWEGRKLIEAAKKYNRVVAAGTQRRSHASHLQAMEFMHSGKLGKLKSVHGVCYKRRGSIGRRADGPVPPGVDYDLWLGPAPVRPFNPNRFHYNWHWFWDYGNGDLGNTGVHDTDVIAWGVRKAELPRKAVCLGGRFGYEDDGETPNTQIAAMDYGDLQVVYEVRGLETAPFHDFRYGVVFHCAEGYVVAALQTAGAFTPKGERIQAFTGRNDDEHFRNFVDAVKSRRPDAVRAGPLEGHLASGLCHLPNISYRLGEPKPFGTEAPFGDFELANECYRGTRDHLKENGVDLAKTAFRMGRVLTFDPKAETFAGDPEANALLRREYRKPFVVPETV
jgi:predicted dehydrogenase